MKKMLLSLLIFISFASQGQKVIGRFYYLQNPRSDVFQLSYEQPTGKSDPNGVPSATEIVSKDLGVGSGASEQRIEQSKNSNNSFLFNSWNHKKGINLYARFFKVKLVSLKSNAWGKIKDNAFHVTEALRADSVVFSISKSKTDTAGTAIIQKIAGLFVDNKTVVGTVLSALGNTDSVQASKKNIATLQYKSKDSISFTLSDSTVYYAVRYVRIGEATDVKTFTGKSRAPECAAGQIKKNPDALVKKVLSQKQTTISLLNDNCDLTNEKIKMNFVFDPGKQISAVYVIRTPKSPVVVGGSAKAAAPDTLFVSEPLDFENEYSNGYSDTYQFASNTNAGKKGSVSELVVCAFSFLFNPQTRELSIKHWNYDEGYYQTCVYKKTADLSFFPR